MLLGMARRPRWAAGEVIYHVLNRGNCRMRIFSKPADYLVFVKLIEEARQRTAMRVLGYCLMSNHWHLVLWPRRDGDLSRFMQWLSSTHVRRWREHRQNVGEGHLYQGRYKSFPVKNDFHLLTLLRYVEANPLRAKQVERAEQWRWSSLSNGEQFKVQLEPWPVDRPRNWAETVNEALPDAAAERLRLSVIRGQPYGPPHWAAQIAKQLGLESTLRDPWRPKKRKASPK
jgi:putative transposase